MVEKCKEALDKGGAYAALFTDLSKAFDCIDHDILTAKLNAFGMDTNSVKLLHSYLTDRKQRVKINSVYSEFSEILNGVPQGSILGPLLTLIYMGFFEVKYHGGGGDQFDPPMIFSERLIILPKYLAHLCISSEGIKILNFFFAYVSIFCVTSSKWRIWG